MNERIRELALQAGFAYEPIKDQLWVSGPTEIMISPGLEKFAELIVQECIDYCGENLSKTVGGALKIHFGVEGK